MKIPAVNHPTFTMKLHASGKKIKYRPFTVKEEKILLIAKMSKDFEDIIDAIKQIISLCVLNEDFNVDEQAVFDVEMLYVNLRAKSVNNTIDFSFKDADDGKKYPVSINLDDVKIVTPEGHSKLIQVNDVVTIEMKYPSFKILYELKDLLQMLVEIDGGADIDPKQILDEMFKIYANCINRIIHDQSILVAGKDFDVDEAIEFLNDLPTKAIEDIRLFFESQPSVEHTVKYTNSLGMEKTYTFKGLSDFFI